jgi:hypothetical protein
MSINSVNQRRNLIKFIEAVLIILGVPATLFALINAIINQPVIALIVALFMAALAASVAVYWGWVNVATGIISWLVLVVMVLGGFVLWPRTMVVEGVIRTPAGEPVRYENVEFFDFKGLEYQTRTDTGGHYEFVNVPAGQYRLRVGDSEVAGAASGILGVVKK